MAERSHAKSRIECIVCNVIAGLNEGCTFNLICLVQIEGLKSLCVFDRCKLMLMQVSVALWHSVSYTVLLSWAY